MTTNAALEPDAIISIAAEPESLSIQSEDGSLSVTADPDVISISD